MKKNILIISFSNIANDPRVLRQVETLKDEYNVTTLGFGELNIKEVNHIRCDFKSSFLSSKIHKAILLKLKLYTTYYWKKELTEAVKKIQECNYDVILGNDISSLPLAVYLKDKFNAKLYFDAHEYSPREFEERFLWNFFHKDYIEYLCQKYLNQVNAMTTVCEGIKNEYEKNYKINATIKIIMSLPDYQELQPSETQLDKIKIIHHGGAIPQRKLEDMIKLMDYTDDRFYLDLMLVKNDKIMEKYYNYLKKLAQNNPRINFISPVPMKQISNLINKYDIGLYLMNSGNFNCKYSLPNKLFEFIQARLAVAIGPSIEMSKIVNKYKCGIVSETFDPRNLQNLAKELNKLSTSDIMDYKRNSDIAAKELNFAKNAKLIKEIVSKLVY